MVDDLKELLRKNPKAAQHYDSMKETMEKLRELRAAGFAGGSEALVLPYSGRAKSGALPKRSARSVVRQRTK